VRAAIILIGVLAVSGLGACRGQTTQDAPIVGIRNMYDQPKYQIQGESEYFADHRSMRVPVEGVVSREAVIDVRIEEDNGYVLTIPQEVVDAAGGMTQLLDRGKGRYGIYCTPCHDSTGTGHGMVARRAAVIPGASALAPTNLNIERIQHMPDGQLFSTITNGIRNMPAYGPQIPNADRWAIVAFVRALQLSQAGYVTPESNP
jgi:mono/diheme cytochrome c family protein